MNRFSFTAIVALLAAACCAPFAAAQTQNIASVSGNGQLICPQCAGGSTQQYDPMVVKVTDQNGNPVANATVNWNLNGQGSISGAGGVFSSTTDATGSAQATYYPNAFNLASGSTPFLQAQISASTVTGSFVTFYATITAPANGTSNSLANQLVLAQVLTPGTTPPCPACADPNDVADPITGVAGSTSSQQVGVIVYSPGGSTAVVQNVEIHLIPNQASPSVSCATGAGADPGTVMTDATGTALCSIVFGSGSGSGTFIATVGGVTPNAYGGTTVFYSSLPYRLNVQPGTPGSVRPLTGSAQTANPGQPLPLPLVAIVGDQSGNPLSGQQVTWTVSPAGAATLTPTSSVSDANGQVRTNVTFSNAAVGAVTITAALASNNKLAAVFTETANVQITGLSKVSGDIQSAILNAPFASPLIVQLTTSNGTPTANVPVQFTITGPGTLSAASAMTGANGQAQVTVTAGATTGTVTVTATAGSFSVAFSLTVIPAGPQLQTSSFYNGADFQRGSISPCSIATIIAPGVAPTVQGAIEANMLGPLPYTLATDTVTINGSQAPIFNVANMNNQQQITFQIPCGLTAGSANVTVGVGGGSSSISVALNPASPGIFGAQQSNGSYLPVLLRPDGSFVSSQNPARRGETVIAFATGLGPATPSLNSNSLPIPGSTAKVQGTVVVGYAGAGIPFTSAQASPDLIGVYEVAFQIPSTSNTGNNDFSIGIEPAGSSTVYYSALGTIPVQ